MTARWLGRGCCLLGPSLRSLLVALASHSTFQTSPSRPHLHVPCFMDARMHCSMVSQHRVSWKARAAWNFLAHQLMRSAPTELEQAVGRLWGRHSF